MSHITVSPHLTVMSSSCSFSENSENCPDDNQENKDKSDEVHPLYSKALCRLKKTFESLIRNCLDRQEL